MTIAAKVIFFDIGATLAKHLGVKPLANGTALL